LALTRPAERRDSCFGEEHPWMGGDRVDQCQAVGLSAPGPCQRKAEYRMRTPSQGTLDLCPVCAAVVQEQVGDAAPVVADVRD
jgi:hypothetical protein